MQVSETSAVPLHLRTLANRLAWQSDREWARNLSLRDRLSLRRDCLKREFLPLKPIRHR